MMSPLTSDGQAFSILSQEESRRSLISVEPQPASVFYSTQHKTEETKKNQLYCDYCNWTGHILSQCVTNLLGILQVTAYMDNRLVWIIGRILKDM